jgi:gas vesicle protein
VGKTRVVVGAVLGMRNTRRKPGGDDMAHTYDHFSNNGSMFLLGLLSGAALGVGIGMLFAPKAGSELRNQLSTEAGALADQAQKGYQKATENLVQLAEKGKDVAGDVADRGKAAYAKARKAVARGADEAQQYVRDTVGTA